MIYRGKRYGNLTVTEASPMFHCRYFLKLLLPLSLPGQVSPLERSVHWRFPIRLDLFASNLL